MRTLVASEKKGVEMKIPSMTPSISNLEVEYVSDAVRSGWGTRRDKYLNLLSQNLSSLTGMEYCIPVSHGTSGIHLALNSVGVGPGDEVIVPDLTWVASASPILHLGATPKFVDVDGTMCLNPSQLRDAINARTRAIVVVDLVGSTPQWDEILDLADETGIPIIEDATESIGSTYKNRAVGSFGLISVFSFNATKLTMSGQGGAICTNNRSLQRRILSLMHHGIDTELSGKYYWSTELGYNFQMSNVQAAMALAQMERIDELIQFKKMCRDWYIDIFAGTALSVVPYPSDVSSNAWMTIGIIDPSLGIEKEEAIGFFQSEGVDLRPFFYRLSDMPTFETYGRNYPLYDSSIGVLLERNGICLPYGYDLTEDQVEYIGHVFNKMCEEIM